MRFLTHTGTNALKDSPYVFRHLYNRQDEEDVLLAILQLLVLELAVHLAISQHELFG